ncbi:hypothetical protein [Massilia sp. METH4]|uniref:hypothetical protein n=1 Tax=Massilia sp. METH4 TaxID=3123041 RepID=UPI0030D416B6
MITIRPAAIALAAIALLAGCASHERSATGTSVRTIMASQMLPPQAAQRAGTDAASAVAGYANYQKSYVTPTPQDSSGMVGGGITRN